MTGSIIRTKGWCQGSVLKDGDLHEILNGFDYHDVEEGMVGVVITQTCDLIHSSEDAEPVFEIILGRIVVDLNGNLSFGKNPRKLQIRMHHLDTSEDLIELVPHDRFVLERGLLKDIEPDSTKYLPEIDLSILISWVAARYARPALPDAFNDRICDSYKKQAKITKSISEHVLALYVDIHPFEELPLDKKYNVTLVAVVSRNFTGDFDELCAEVDAFGDLLRAGNMDVVVKVMKEDKAPYTLVTKFKRYSLDYLSYRSDPPDPMPDR